MKETLIILFLDLNLSLILSFMYKNILYLSHLFLWAPICLPTKKCIKMYSWFPLCGGAQGPMWMCLHSTFSVIEMFLKCFTWIRPVIKDKFYKIKLASSVPSCLYVYIYPWLKGNEKPCNRKNVGALLMGSKLEMVVWTHAFKTKI